jgi:hypothetical protein
LIAGGGKYRYAAEHILSSSGISTERDTTSGDEGSAPRGYSERHEGIIGGKELAVLRYAEQLMYIRTLFVDPFPGVLKLNAWVLDVWREAEEELAEVEQSTKSKALVRGS